MLVFFCFFAPFPYQWVLFCLEESSAHCSTNFKMFWLENEVLTQREICFDWTMNSWKKFWLGGKWLWKLSIDVAAALFQVELDLSQNKQQIRAYDIFITDVTMEESKEVINTSVLTIQNTLAYLWICTTSGLAFPRALLWDFPVLFPLILL